jgi:hypothetical protein
VRKKFAENIAGERRNLNNERFNKLYTKNGILQEIECDRMFGACSKLWKGLQVLSEIRNMKEKDHFEWNSKIKIDLGKTNYIGVG